MRRPSLRASAVAMTVRAPLISAASAALIAPAAGAAPITVASVTPSAVAAPGTATVVLRIAGADVDSTASIVIRGTELERSTLSDEVESLSILSAGISGKSTLSTTLPPLAGMPPNCERGGIHASSSLSAYKLAVPAHDVSALVVKVKVPLGFAGATPELEVSSSPLRAVTAGPNYGLAPKDDVVRAAIPRTGPTLDGVEMKIAAATVADTYVAKGRIVPARAGAMIRLVGSPADNGPDRPQVTMAAVQAFGDFASAMAPIGGELQAYAKARTNAAGRYAVRFTAPRGTVLVARSRGLGGTTLPGASCPVQLGD